MKYALSKLDKTRFGLFFGYMGVYIFYFLSAEEHAGNVILMCTIFSAWFLVMGIADCSWVIEVIVDTILWIQDKLEIKK